MEVWKNIKGFEDIYKINNVGKIVRIENNRIVRAKRNNRGYWQIRLYKNNKAYHYLLHRLVGIAFVENPNTLPQINHKDENKDNNHSNNLEWCTNIYNRHYGTGIERMAKNRNYKAIMDKVADKLTKGAVNQYDLEGNYIKTWRSATAPEKEGIAPHISVRKCCLGIFKQSGGYKWGFACENNK